MQAPQAVQADPHMRRIFDVRRSLAASIACRRSRRLSVPLNLVVGQTGQWVCHWWVCLILSCVVFARGDVQAADTYPLTLSAGDHARPQTLIEFPLPRDARAEVAP